MTCKCQVILSAIRMQPSDDAEMISQILYGERCEILDEQGYFAKVRTISDDVEGWMDGRHLVEADPAADFFLVEQNFGVYDLPEGRSLLSMGSEVEFPVETRVQLHSIRESISNIAASMLNVPHLHGGRSYFGLDDDGLVQLLYKIHQIRLPREAEKQAQHGEVLDFIGECEAGDLAFFDDDACKICHVGIMLNTYQVLHVDEKVRIDSLDSSGIYNSELKKHTHKLRFVKRIL